MISTAFSVLALTGFIISSYFTAIAYHWIEPNAAWIPSFCRMGEQTCAQIVFTPRARVFGVPNSLLGQVYYIALLIGLWGDFMLTSPLYSFYLSASLLTVATGVYLTYSLLFMTRVPCKLCFTSHGINLVIFVLLLTAGRWV